MTEVAYSAQPEGQRTSIHLAVIIRELEGRSGTGRRVAGVTLGGCVNALGTERQGAMRRSAHAHTSKSDPHRGWICVKGYSIERVMTRNGRATRLLIHEVAHALTLRGHDAEWRYMVGHLGAPSEALPYLRAKR